MVVGYSRMCSPEQYFIVSSFFKLWDFVKTSVNIINSGSVLYLSETDGIESCSRRNDNFKYLLENHGQRFI